MRHKHHITLHYCCHCRVTTRQTVNHTGRTCLRCGVHTAAVRIRRHIHNPHAQSA